MSGLDRSSRNRLTERLIPQFAGETLFDAIARAVCRAGCLPRKELYEAWEVARRVRRRYRGGRIVDLAAGHGLLAMVLLLLDDSSPEALAVDRHIPESAAALVASLTDAWPRLKDRIRLVETDLGDVPLRRDDLIVSVHACGGLTDLIIERARAAGARMAVVPCCHDLDGADLGGLQGWLDGPLAMDVARVARLRSQGYRVVTHRIPHDITPKNRLLLAEPEFLCHYHSRRGPSQQSRRGDHMLIERIREDRLKALKARDEKTKNLLGVLIADACRDEKQPDDTTVIRFVKKFIENAKENLQVLEKGSGTSESRQDAQREVEILMEYLPSQLTGDSLMEAIRQVMTLEAIEAQPSNMGKVMKAMGIHYAGKYDGKEASEAVKGILSGKN